MKKNIYENKYKKINKKKFVFLKSINISKYNVLFAIINQLQTIIQKSKKNL